MQQISKHIFFSLIILLSMINISYSFSTEAGGHKTITERSAIIENELHPTDARFKLWLDQTMDSLAKGSFLTGIHRK